MWGRVMAAWGELGNECFHFHDLRTKAITTMAKDGRQARDLSGHKTDAMVTRA